MLGCPDFFSAVILSALVAYARYKKTTYYHTRYTLLAV